MSSKNLSVFFKVYAEKEFVNRGNVKELVDRREAQFDNLRAEKIHTAANCGAACCTSEISGPVPHDCNVIGTRNDISGNVARRSGRQKREARRRRVGGPGLTAEPGQQSLGETVDHGKNWQ